MLELPKFLTAAILCLIGFAIMTCRCVPVQTDQRQEGDFNLRADLQNFVVLLIPSTKNDAFNLLEFISKTVSSTKNKVRNNDDQSSAAAVSVSNNADMNAADDDHYYEPSSKPSDNFYKESKLISPYQVEIGSKKSHQSKQIQNNNNNSQNSPISNIKMDAVPQSLAVAASKDSIGGSSSDLVKCSDSKRNVNGNCESINQL